METLEKEILRYLTERGWHKVHPGDLAKSISIESAELLELFQWYNPTLEEVKKDKEKLKQISKELADVLIYCLDMSVVLGLNTSKIIKEKLKDAKKKYPAKIMKTEAENSYPGSDNYWRIKNQYRKKSI